MADEQTADNRVIAHFDIDCFYAQSEELRCPSLQGRPVGVTQKFLVVTSNYVARSLGVPKMVSIAEAKKKLPTLVLINGEDLTPYRADSKRIMAVLRRFGTVERHGLDEGAVDITAKVEARLKSGPPTLSFSGHVLGLGTQLRTSTGPQSGILFNFESMQLNLETLPLVDVSLLVGSQVVAEMRQAIETETGFRCSCGVAQNKMLAKLSSSLNKPSMQTCMLQGAVAEFLAPMSVRRIPGVGQQIHGVLTGMNVDTIADLGQIPLKQLSERLGDRIASLLFNAARGRDLSPVEDKGPPKSISVEDSFRKCETMQRATEILRVLAPDLIRRLDEDREETGRRPKSFTMKWRVQGTKWNFVSVSTQMPLELVSPSMTVEKRAFLLVDVATKLLSRSLQEPFHLVVLNIGATNFESASSSPGTSDIRAFLQGKGKSPEKELKVISKRDARASRESFKTMATNAPSAGHPLQNIQTWDALSKAQIQDEDGLSNNSEDEEADDLADQLRLSRRPSSSKQSDDKKMHIPGRTSGLKQKEFSNRQGSPISKRMRLSSSGEDLSSGLFMTSGNLDETTSCRKAQDVNSAPFDTLMEQSFSPPNVANIEDGAVGPHLSERGPVAQCGTLLSTSRTDFNCEGNTRTDDIIMTKMKLPTEPYQMSTEGHGSEQDNVCEECGKVVEDTDSGRQEHADYHFALSLEQQERNSLPAESPESSRIPSTAKRGRGAPSAPSSRKSKSRNGTLDGFVVRRP
ncbi:unnamed protein product [Calypogeia fissa]